MSQTARNRRSRHRLSGVRRNLIVEFLEARQLLASDIHQPMDVNQDSVVSPSDALQVINSLSGTTARQEQHDVNRDGEVTPLDALQIINHLASSPTFSPSLSSAVALEQPPAPMLSPDFVDWSFPQSVR